MPRVKFDYIVSFSSEDPEHPASNLLSLEVSKKKWLSAAGETSASVVLQLEKAVQIGTVAVGAHHAALVEVLVGRSESPADPYQVLVASSVFLSPSESRKAEGAGVERVRTFSAPAPAPATGAGAGAGGTVWAQRWDRLRLSLSQPYNKHCKFGLSFVHCFTPEAAPVGARGSSLESALAAGAGATGAGALFADEDEDEFKPGELFAQHKLQANTETTRDTGGQIRRATSHVLRTSSSEGGGDGGGGGGGGGARLARRRMHGDDTASERDQKRKRDPSRERARGVRHRHDGRIHSSQERDGATSRGGGARGTRDKDDKHRDMSRDTTDESRESSKKKDSLKRKRAEGGAGVGGGVLAGVVCVLSGYLHPRRGALRAALLALGARVRPHWGPGCTHLICAFPKTPKLLALRRGEGGERVPAVTARWVEECARLQRRLPEEWYSTEPARRLPVPPGAGAGAGAIVADDSEDTDDEIERVGRESRDRRDRRDSPDSAEHRVQGSVSDGGEGEGDTTDGEGEEGGGEEEEVGVERARALPPLLRDMVFVPAPAGRHVDRYVLAYGGTILPLEEVEGAVYALCEGAGAGAGAGAGGVRRLRLRWLWRAHEEGRLPPLDAYSIDS